VALQKVDPAARQSQQQPSQRRPRLQVSVSAGVDLADGALVPVANGGALLVGGGVRISEERNRGAGVAATRAWLALDEPAKQSRQRGCSDFSPRCCSTTSSSVSCGSAAKDGAGINASALSASAPMVCV